MLRNIFFAFIFLSPLATIAQTLASAPIQGHTTTSSIKVWLMVQNAKECTLVLDDSIIETVDLKQAKGWENNVPVTAEFTGLAAGTTYPLRVMLDGKLLADKFILKTYPEATTGDYSFVMGSCAYYGMGAWSAIKPGSFTTIFDHMTATPSDFSLWLGDNVYLLGGEWNDHDRMYRKYTTVRTDAKINAFLRSRPQYAVRDDHDFGPDNSGAEFANKGATTTCFQEFWPNPYAGTEETPGVFCHFSFQDSDFFLTDGRYYRIDSGHTQIIGPAQMHWLKEKLLASTATFKFVATGSQTLSEVNEHETWFGYKERDELLDFIAENKITGVVFLSGDRHFTEMMKLERKGLYPLYEITCSPLTSIVRKAPGHKNDPEFVNPLRLDGTMVLAHNYGRVSVVGPMDDRVCKIEIFDANGKLLWTREIKANDLRWT